MCCVVQELSLQWCLVDRDVDVVQWKWIRIVVLLNIVNKEICSVIYVYLLFIRIVECF